MRRPFPLAISALFLMGLIIGKAGAAEEPATNPYTKNYISRMSAAKGATGGEVQVFRGQDRVEDYQRLLEDGYDLLGYSSFEAADVPPEKVKEQAERVRADLALVYTVRSGETPASVKLDRARDKMKKAEDGEKSSSPPLDNKFYNYFASFWTRLPTPLLGVHVKQGKDAAAAKGLEVIAVIKGSPAAAAGLQKGDTLLKLGEIELNKPELLSQAAQRYAGQQAEVVFDRMGNEQRQTVTLNGRQ